jgi:pyruvate kinase
MDAIVRAAEADPHCRTVVEASGFAPQPTVGDAICAALQQSAELLGAAAIVTFTRSGFTSLRAARERPQAPIVSVTPDLATARRLALAWGVHSVHVPHDVDDVPGMVQAACTLARAEGFAQPGDTIVIAAGMPFGKAGTTNLLHIAQA